MKYPTALLLALAWTTSSAFHVVPTMPVARRRVILRDTSVQRPMDKARAQYCAENFGACSVDEIEEMRERKHILIALTGIFSSVSLVSLTLMFLCFFPSRMSSSPSRTSPELYVWRIGWSKGR
jgi:hypothetical protein